MSFLLVAVTLLAGSCTKPVESSPISPTVEDRETWLERKRAEWNELSEQPLKLPSVFQSFSVDSEMLIWIVQTQKGSEVWMGGTNRGAKGRRLLLSDSHDLLTLALSPSKKQVLMLGQRRDSLERREKADLLHLDLTSLQTRTLSSEASVHTHPQWISDGAYLWGRLDAEGVSLVKSDADEGDELLLHHKAPYARLKLLRLWPDGWLLLDRNTTEDSHFWYSRANVSDSLEWHEVYKKSTSLRLLGWREERPLFVTRTGEKDYALCWGDFLDGDLALSSRVLYQGSNVDEAVLCKDAVLFARFAEWSHHLERLDLKSGERVGLSIPFGPRFVKWLELQADGTAAFTLEGPTRSPVPYSWSGGQSVRELMTPETDLQLKFQVNDEGTVSLNSRSPALAETPVLLEGYGAFRTVPLPFFDPVKLFWLSKGGKVTVTQIESEPLGQERAVRKLLQIVREQGSRPIVYRGRSFGGTLGLLAAQAEPQAFSSVWAEAPVTDLEKYHLYPPGELWLGELGDPSAPTQVLRLRRLSPLNNLSLAMPFTVVSTALNDPVVNSIHSIAFARAAETKAPGRVLFVEDERGLHETTADLHQTDLQIAELLWRRASATQDADPTSEN